MTISYNEKGAGLHEAIRKAGQWLREENGVWVSSDDAAVQAIIDAYNPLPNAIAQVKTAIDAHAAKLRNIVTAGISPAEMASWPLKTMEARAYLADNSASVPMLAAEAAARAIPLLEMAQRVHANAEALGGLETAIAGTAGKHRDAVEKLATFQEVLAYDFSQGWPL